MESLMDRVALQQRLADIEARISSLQQQIAEQRDVIVKLEGAGQTAEHAKYLLAGLELLYAAHRDNRTAMLGEFALSSSFSTPRGDVGFTSAS
jgi:hypothetical protein